MRLVTAACGPRCRIEQEDGGDTVNRLIVSFDEIGKTVKSRVSPALYGYFEEAVLLFGVNIVSFKNSSILDEVRVILQSQPGASRRVPRLGCCVLVDRVVGAVC